MTGIVEDGGWIYGLQLPVQTLTRTLCDPWEDAATVDDLVRIAQTAESTGHSFVGVCDHIAIPDNDYASHMTTTWYDTVATMAFLAAHTNTVHLASTVWVAGYRHPLQTAKSFATIDHLSGGRVILGVGAGHVEAEFEALGIDFHSRGRLLDETLDAVNAAFDDTYVSFHGDRYSYDDVGIGPQPVSGNRLPVWVGGSGQAAWRRCGRRGDGYIPMGNQLDTYPEIIDTIHAEAAAAGRSDTTFDIGYMGGWSYLTGDVPDDMPPSWIHGPEAMAESLRAARAAGANTMHLKFRGRDLEEYLDQFAAFAELVVPLVDEA